MKRAVLATLTLVAGSLVVTAAPAQAAICGIYDYTQPTYVSSSVSPTSIVIGKTARSITVTVRAKDDCGVRSTDLVLTPKVKPSSGTIWLRNFVRTSGTPLDGTWKATQTVSPYLPGGAWEASQMNINDVNGNQRTKLFPTGTLQIRHETKLTLAKPDKYKKSTKKKGDNEKRVEFRGRLTIYGDYFKSSVVLQSRTNPRRSWTTEKRLTTDVWGNYSTTLERTKTKYYRTIHEQDNLTTASTSKTYKVTK